jgi:hypothetical protein
VQKKRSKPARRVALGLITLVVVAAACSSTSSSSGPAAQPVERPTSDTDRPAVMPPTTAKAVVDLIPQQYLDVICSLQMEHGDRAAFRWFAEGYGDIDPGMPTARAAFDEAITRC